MSRPKRTAAQVAGLVALRVENGTTWVTGPGAAWPGTGPGSPGPTDEFLVQFSDDHNTVYRVTVTIDQGGVEP